MTAILRDRVGQRSLSSLYSSTETISQGIDAEYVSLEDVVPPYEVDVNEDQTLPQEFYDDVAQAFGERIKECDSRVPVVTGFFGPIPGSLLHQVGRGYTDLCAALLAAGLEASELQIWKEVDGIFTADPRKVPTARFISAISPEEAAELSYYGSEVVHPFTMEQAIRKSIPIRIKNVENPRRNGTVIRPNTEDNNSSSATISHPVPEPITSKSFQNLMREAEATQRKRSPTAVTIKENIVILNINSNRKSGFLANIFSILDKFGVVVDLISTSEVHVSMAFEDYPPRNIFERLIRELNHIGTVDIFRDMTILSLVGKEMRTMVGIAGKMFTTLAQGNINIEMISQGASEINISCVIRSRDAVRALNLIHQTCLQIKPEGVTGGLYVSTIVSNKPYIAGPWLF